MELKNIKPDIERTFGKLEFAGNGKDIKEGFGKNSKVIGKVYNLYSDVQRADNISVILPPNKEKKEFHSEDRIELVNPEIKAEGYKIGDRAYTNYLLYADDIKKVGE